MGVFFILPHIARDYLDYIDKTPPGVRPLACVV